MLIFRILVCMLIVLSASNGNSLEQSALKHDASFARLSQNLNSDVEVNIVFFGGSLTWGANASDPQLTSYRGRTQQWMTEHFPKAHLHFWDAAIGGTGSALGIYRLERDVLSRKPDLVFLDFTVNDGISSDSMDNNNTYETLLREMIGRGIPVVQVILGTKPNFQEPLDKTPRRLTHLKLHEAYHTGLADTLPVIQDLVKVGKVNLDANYPFESTHPDDPGYELFFEIARDGLLTALKDGTVCRVPSQPVFPGVYTQRTRLELSELPQLPKGWKKDRTLRTSLWFDGLASRWMDGVIACNPNAMDTEPLVLEFTGRTVGMFGEGKADGLKFEVLIDGQPVPTNGKEWTSNAPMPGNLFYWRQLATDLQPGKHKLEIIPLPSADQSAKGQLRIGYIGYAE